jgi:hypothetical protein
MASAATDGNLGFKDADGTSIENTSAAAYLLDSAIRSADYYSASTPNGSPLEVLVLVSDTGKGRAVERSLWWLADGFDAAKPLQSYSLLEGNAFAACGLCAETDTSGQVAVLELCIGNRSLVIHKSSGGFENPTLRNVLQDAVLDCSSGRIALLFTGADLAKLALALWSDLDGLALHHCIDVTPILSQELSKKGTIHTPSYNRSMSRRTVAGSLPDDDDDPPFLYDSDEDSGEEEEENNEEDDDADEMARADILALHGPRDKATALRHFLLSGAPSCKLSLDVMVNGVLGTDKARPWQISKEVTTSDWSALPLSLPQIKHCVLSAWASKVVGEFAVSPVGGSKIKQKRRHTFKLLPESLLGLPMPTALEQGMQSLSLSDAKAPLKVELTPFSLRNLASHPSRPLAAVSKLMRETAALEQAQKREFAVVISHIGPPELYNPRSHVSLRGSVYDKRLRNGSPAEIFFYQFPPNANTGALSGVGSRGQTESKKKPPLIWRIEGEVVKVQGKVATVKLNFATARKGSGATTFVDGPAIIAAWQRAPACMEIKSHNYGQADLPLERAFNAVSGFFRSSSAYTGTSDGDLLGELAMKAPAALAWRLFLQLPIPHLPSVACLGSIDAAYKHVSAKYHKQISLLNESQARAFLHAHTRPISVIRGPPGTGEHDLSS